MEENAREALVCLKLNKGFDLNKEATVTFERGSLRRKRGGFSEELRASGSEQAMGSERLEEDLSSKTSKEKSISEASDDVSKETNMEAGSQTDSEPDSDSDSHSSESPE